MNNQLSEQNLWNLQNAGEPNQTKIELKRGEPQNYQHSKQENSHANEEYSEFS